MCCPCSPVADDEYGRRMDLGVFYDFAVSDMFINSKGNGQKGSEQNNQNTRQIFPIYTFATPE